MPKLSNFYNKRKAVTLVEILLAMVLMAGAFLPIMAMMSTSIKATEQDENTQRAVRLCQEKMNMALQMPFDTFPSSDSPQPGIKKGDIDLKLGVEIFDGVTYNSVLKVATQTIKFTVPTCDFKKRYVTASSTPDRWEFNPIDYIIDDKMKRYTLTVTWKDKGSKSKEKFYTLSTLKANLKEP